MTIEENAPERAHRRRITRAQVVRFIQAIRDSDQATVNEMVLRLSRARPWLAPLAFAVASSSSVEPIRLRSSFQPPSNCDAVSIFTMNHRPIHCVNPKLARMSAPLQWRSWSADLQVRIMFMSGPGGPRSV